MKNQTLNRLCLCIAICTSLHASSQDAKQDRFKEVTINEPDYAKPKLFKDQSDRININPSLDFKSIVRLKTGQSVNIPFSGNFSFNGTIVSVSDDFDPNVKSIVVKSLSRQGAVLTLSEITNEDKSVSYVGRILSQQHGDAFEMIHEDGKYAFKKKGFYELITE
jgi:hypothetical protein